MFRRIGTLSLVFLSFFLLCGDTAPATCNPQPQPSHVGAEVAAVAVVAGVVIGTVVLVEVHKSHHTVKGCVTAGPNGVQIKTDDMKIWNLVGDTNVKVGDLVRVHGNRVKKVKGDTGDQTFSVEKLNKDYGPCKIPAAAKAP